jgi:hypothetical protein
MIIYQNVPAFYVCALELYKKIFRLSYFADENAETRIGQANLKISPHIVGCTYKSLMEAAQRAILTASV